MRIGRNKFFVRDSSIENGERKLFICEVNTKYEQTFSFFFTAVPSSVTKACDWAFMASLT